MRGKQASGARQDPQPQRYQIRVRGRLGQTIRAAFPALRARTRGDDTTLTGPIADQAALYGVLAEIEALARRRRRTTGGLPRNDEPNGDPSLLRRALAATSAG
jgi:hypothetical protein